MSEPTDPAGVAATPARGPIAPGRHRVHLSYVALRALKTLRQLGIAFLAFGLATIPRLGDASGWVQLLGLAFVALLLLLVLAGFAFISYKHFSWELTESELHVYEGFFFKKEAHIPFKRIHSIDYSAGMVERILGVVSLRIETAGGGAKAEAEIMALRLAEAEALRSEVFARKQRLTTSTAPEMPDASGSVADFGATLARLSESARGAYAGSYEDGAPVEYEYHLTLKELVLAGISSSNVFLLLLAVVGASSQIIAFAGGSESAIIDYAQGAAAYVLSFGIVVAVVLTVLALLIAWAISITTTVLSYGGFTVRRRGGRVEVEKGLLEHRFNGAAIDRVQSVRIKQGALRRLIGFAEVSLDIVSSPGSDGAASAEKGLVVHPLIRRSKADTFIAAVLPEFSDTPEPLVPLSGAARRLSIFRTTFWPALALALVALSFNLFAQPLLPIPSWSAPLAVVVLLVPCPFIGQLAWSARGYARNRDMLVIRTGGLGLDTRIVPRGKIQWAKSTAGPFQRRVGLATVSVWTAAGTSGTAVALDDVDDATARETLEWVEPRTAARASAAPESAPTGEGLGSAGVELP